jgi:hypothetical protein
MATRTAGPRAQRRRRRHRAALLLGILGFGYGTIPALGPALDPGRVAWTSAYDATPVTSHALHVPGPAKPVTASFTKDAPDAGRRLARPRPRPAVWAAGAGDLGMNV